MFRSGRKTMSEAVRDGVSSWALDDETVLTEKAKGTKYLGVLDRDSGAIWLTPIETYLDRAKFKILNYTGRGGALQRYVGFQHFVMKPGVVRKL